MAERIGASSNSGVNSEEEMSPSIIGNELKKIGKLTKDKISTNEKKLKSQKWIMSKKLEHLLLLQQAGFSKHI